VPQEGGGTHASNGGPVVGVSGHSEVEQAKRSYYRYHRRRCGDNE